MHPLLKIQTHSSELLQFSLKQTHHDQLISRTIPQAGFIPEERGSLLLEKQCSAKNV